MAKEESLQKISLPVAADYSASQYCFGSIDSNGRFALVSLSGSQADGVLQDKPDAQDKIGCIGISGVTKAKAGGSFSAGDLVMANNAGKVVLATSGSAVVGVALDAGADGRIVSVLLKLQAADL